MKYVMCSLSAVIIACGVFFGVVFQNDLFADFLREGAGLMVAIPLTLILSLVAVGMWLEKCKVGKIMSFSIVVGLSSIISLYCFGKTGALINNWKIQDVESYVDRAVPVLDRLKQKNGSYPSKLPVDLLGEPPEFLRCYGDYTATPTNFYFEYVDEPAGWAGGDGSIKFDSMDRKWEYAR